MASTKDNIFQLRYDQEEAQMLRELAASKGLSASGYLRMLIREQYEQLQQKRK